MTNYQTNRVQEWSWHENARNFVTNPVFNTMTTVGSCGCCSMVASLNCCAASYAARTGNPAPNLSIQELINGVPIVFPQAIRATDLNGCSSAACSVSLSYIQQCGVGLAIENPYQGRRTSTERDPVDGRRFTIDKYTALNHYGPEVGDNSWHQPPNTFCQVPYGGGPVIQNLIRQSPIIGEFLMYPSFELAQDGVYDCAIQTDTDRAHHAIAGEPNHHAIVIVGYGTVYGTISGYDGVPHPHVQKFFWCQNTFGPDWGLYGGYVKIARHNFVRFYSITGADFQRRQR